MATIIRMCIGCRERFEQNFLNRLKCENESVISYNGYGRSFYICKNCLENKNIEKKIFKICKSKNIDFTRLREIVNI